VYFERKKAQLLGWALNAFFLAVQAEKLVDFFCLNSKQLKPSDCSGLIISHRVKETIVKADAVSSFS
jgi:hypothetical protein